MKTAISHTLAVRYGNYFPFSINLPFFFHYFQLPQTPHQKVKEVELNEVQYGDEQFMCICSYLKK